MVRVLLGASADAMVMLERAWPMMEWVSFSSIGGEGVGIRIGYSFWVNP